MIEIQLFRHVFLLRPVLPSNGGGRSRSDASSRRQSVSTARCLVGIRVKRGASDYDYPFLLQLTLATKRSGEKLFLLTRFMVTIRSYCCLWPFFLFLPVFTEAAFGVTLTCPFWAEGFWAGFAATFAPGATFCPAVNGAFWPVEPFWFTWPTPSAGLLRAYYRT